MGSRGHLLVALAKKKMKKQDSKVTRRRLFYEGEVDRPDKENERRVMPDRRKRPLKEVSPLGANSNSEDAAPESKAMRCSRPSAASLKGQNFKSDPSSTRRNPAAVPPSGPLRNLAPPHEAHYQHVIHELSQQHVDSEVPQEHAAYAVQQQVSTREQQHQYVSTKVGAEHYMAQEKRFQHAVPIPETPHRASEIMAQCADSRSEQISSDPSPIQCTPRSSLLREDIAESENDFFMENIITRNEAIPALITSTARKVNDLEQLSFEEDFINEILPLDNVTTCFSTSKDDSGGSLLNLSINSGDLQFLEKSLLSDLNFDDHGSLHGEMPANEMDDKPSEERDESTKEAGFPSLRVAKTSPVHPSNVHLGNSSTPVTENQLNVRATVIEDQLNDHPIEKLISATQGDSNVESFVSPIPETGAAPIQIPGQQGQVNNRAVTNLIPGPEEHIDVRPAESAIPETQEIVTTNLNQNHNSMQITEPENLTRVAESDYTDLLNTPENINEGFRPVQVAMPVSPVLESGQREVNITANVHEENNREGPAEEVHPNASDDQNNNLPPAHEMHEDVPENDIPEMNHPQQKVTKRQKLIENKLKKLQGKEYLTRKGETVRARQVKEVECKCPFKCKDLSLEDCIKMKDSYYALGDFSRQRDWLKGVVHKKFVTKHAVHTQSHRQCFYQYHARIHREDGESLVRVCRKKFLAIVDISKNVVHAALQTNEAGNTKADRRGTNPPIHKLSEEQKAAVREHINKFPRTESHYCRATSQRLYLAPSLNYSRMFRDYKKFMQDRPGLLVSYWSYKRIFKKEFNLAFHRPKKDQCRTCAIYKNLSEEEKELQKEKYETHHKIKEMARAQKAKDKKKAMEDQSFRSYTFDLESVLYTPCSNVSNFYYTRKLCTYNLTFFEQATRKGTCYVWCETEGKRGSDEVGSILLKVLQNLPVTVTCVSLFCDCCGGQNRNRYIACVLLHAVRTLHLLEIWLNFLESGHTQMECDSMHATIEKAKKNLNVYCAEEWPEIIRGARVESVKSDDPVDFYDVNVLTFNDFHNLKDLKKNSIKEGMASDSNKEKVNWMNIKRLCFKKEHPNAIFFSYSYEDTPLKSMPATCPNYSQSNSRPRRGRPRQNLQNLGTAATLKKAYDAQLPISVPKYEDLTSLCRSNVLPRCHHNCIYNLPSSVTVRDCLPEPDVQEVDQDGPGMELPEPDYHSSDEEND